MKHNFTLKHLLLFFALAFLGGIFGGYIAGGSSISALPPGPLPANDYLKETSMIDAVDQVGPSVVTIVATRDLPLYQDRPLNFDDSYFGELKGNTADDDGTNPNPNNEVSGGSGIIISSDGLVLTNYHVVDDSALEYSIIMNDERSFAVTDIKFDQTHDIAILRLSDEDGNSPQNLPLVKLGNSDRLRVGQYVVAIGNPLARFSNSVTAGIVSALGRSIASDDVDGYSSLDNLIQTDASIHPGNSGGPLINLQGEVIGINTAIATYADGIGFAVPINDIENFVENMKKELN